jgi:hypothetical protein
VTLRFQRDQAKAMQRYFQQQKAATIADRSQCGPAIALMVIWNTQLAMPAAERSMSFLFALHWNAALTTILKLLELDTLDRLGLLAA